jgi:hypothetical protein
MSWLEKISNLSNGFYNLLAFGEIDFIFLKNYSRG